MSEIIHKSSRGTVEVFEENGEKRIRRTIYAKMSLYELLRNFDCRYLPQIYSVDISDGKTVVTEEFITGKNLLDANLDEKQVIRAMMQLCAALEFIHGLGIVHRDIKPSNILLSEDGDIRLIDFEAARFVRDDKDRDTRYLGTDGFAPPEQYGFSQTDFRTDIYAAGQTMKILLGSISAKKKYAKIIRKCTALDPAERYQSAKELADALTNKCGKISVFAVLAIAAVVSIFAAFVPKDIPAENIPYETGIVDEAETAAETTTTTAVPETEFTAKTTTASKTETTVKTETAAETESVSETTVPTETENASETTITAETEITTKSTTAAETKSTTTHTTVPQTETTAKTKTSAVTTAAYSETIPDNLPSPLSSKEYAALPERQKYYTKVNIQSPAYAWVGDEETGFKVDSGSYLLKNTHMWIAMYYYDYINNDILINGKVAVAKSSGGSSNFGIEYTIDTDESVLNITTQPTVSRKSTVRLEADGVEVTYYVDDWTKGGYINNGDVVRYDTPILISCYKNLIAGYDITVNGKIFPVQNNRDNTYMLGSYTPNSKETVISKVKRSKLTEYEKSNFVPVYFSSAITVCECPFSDGNSKNEWQITYNSGDIIKKGSKIRIVVYPSDYKGKVLKINGNTFDMRINGDGSGYLFDYVIPTNIDSLNITL